MCRTKYPVFIDGSKLRLSCRSKNVFLFLAIAEVYKNEGNDEYRRKEYNNAVEFYTEGIEVNCKDDDLNAKLYSNRETAHFYQGKSTLFECQNPRWRGKRKK